MKIIDLQKWKRKSYFEFFGAFDEPFFSITSFVNSYKAYHHCKHNQQSFFSFYLHAALKAANKIEEFRTRLVNDQIVLFNTIHASPTIARSDGTFGFGFVAMEENLAAFSKTIEAETNRIRSFEGLGLDQQTARHDVIHFSAIPWIHFSSITHARHNARYDSIPKITFGKMNDAGQLPVSVTMHHGFADGKHVAQFLEIFQHHLENVPNH